MSNYIRNDLTGGLAPVNKELEKIEQVLREKLDRLPEQGQANQLTTDLDVNNQRILNVPAPSNPTDLVRLKDLDGFTNGNGKLPPQDGQAGEWLRTDGENAYWDVLPDFDKGGVSPEDFGAVGDGVTDDTAALQAAIDAAKGDGSLGLPVSYVRLENDTYAHTGLTIDRAVAIVGVDRNSTRLKCLSTSAPAIQISLAHDGNNYQTAGRPGPTVLLKDVIVESDKSFPSSNHGIELVNASSNAIRGWVYLDGVDIHSMGGSSLYANTWEGAVKANNCKFLNNGGKQLNATSCADWQFVGCEFGVTPDDNILLSGSAAFTFTTCNIYSSTGDLVTLFTDAAATSPVNHHFVSCSFDRSSQGHGVVYNVRNGGNVTFTNCYWTYNGQGAPESYSDIWIDSSVGRGPTIVGGWFQSAADSDSLYNIFFNGSLSSCYTTGVQFEAGNARSTNVTNSLPQLKFEGAENFTTFAEAQSCTWAEVGDKLTVVERDNAAYIVKDSGYVAVTGDVTDAVGNVWELQLSLVVSPEMFGAGSIDDFTAIKAMHDRCNAENKPVLATGEYTLNATETVIVKTNSDYSQAKVNIADSVSLLELFKIETTSSTVINPPATDFVKGATVLADVASYPNSLIAINSNDTFVLRNGSDPILKRDVVYHSENGFLSHPLLFDMATINEVIIKPAEAYTLEFKCPVIEYANCSLTYFLRSDRNQVRVYGSRVINNGPTTPSIVVYFGPTACMDNALIGKSGDPLSDWDSGASSYDYSGGQVLRPYVSDVVSPHSWAAVDGNCYRDLIVERVTSSRIGAHSMLANATIRDCTLTEKAIQVTGMGKLKIENVNKVSSTNAAGSLNVLVDLREDYGGEWDGEIEIDGFTLDYTNISLGDQDGAIVRLPFNGDVDYGKEIKYPKVIAKNGKITMSSSGSTFATYNLVEFFRYPEEQLYTRVMPKNITLKDIEVIVPSGSAVVSVNPMRTPNIDSANISGTINVTVDNVGYDFDKSTLPIPQGGRSIKVNATTAEKASPSYAVNYTFKNCEVDAIFQAPSTWTLSCRDCDVYNFDNFFSSQQGEGYTEARNSNIWSGRYSGNAPKGFYACTLKVDGVTNAANINAGVVRFSEGVIESGFTLSGKTNAEWVNGFYDGTYFEPT